MLCLHSGGPGHRLALENYLWNCTVKPQTHADMSLDDEGLKVRFEVMESNPLTTALTQQEPMLMVCQDSAVELFLAFPDDEHDQNFKPELEHCLYLNIEINSHGICYAKHGHSRKNRTAFTSEQIASLKIRAERASDRWSVELIVPRKLIRELAHYDAFSPEHVWAFNLYKISESSETEHYIAYNRVDVSAPNFHLPEYFALCRVTG